MCVKGQIKIMVNIMLPFDSPAQFSLQLSGNTWDRGTDYMAPEMEITKSRILESLHHISNPF